MIWRKSECVRHRISNRRTWREFSQSVVQHQKFLRLVRSFCLAETQLIMNCDTGSRGMWWETIQSFSVITQCIFQHALLPDFPTPALPKTASFTSGLFAMATATNSAQWGDHEVNRCQREVAATSSVHLHLRVCGQDLQETGKHNAGKNLVTVMN